MKGQLLPQIIFISLSTLISACSEHASSPHQLQGFIEGEFTYIASNVPGVLEQLNIHRGQKVTPGLLLFKLDPEPEKSQLKAAEARFKQAKYQLNNLKRGERTLVLTAIEAQLEEAKANLSLAKSELDRNESLYKESLISKLRYDQLTTNFKTATEKVNHITAELSEAKLGAREDLILAQQATVEIAAAEVSELMWRLKQKTATSDVDGKVFDTFFHVDEFVPTGQPVLALLSQENIKLIFYVPQPFLHDIQMGKEVTFTCPGCQTSVATIRYISFEAEYTPPIIYSKDTREKLMFRVEAELNKRAIEMYHPGQPVDVNIRSTQKSQMAGGKGNE